MKKAMIDNKQKAMRITDMMMEKDLFSQWLGVERLGEAEGFCKLKMKIRPEMCNGFEIAHGGITYSLADSALAFASNSHGRKSLSIETNISHIKSLKAGDVIIATAEEKNLSNRIGIYDIRIERENGELVGLFKGTVFRKDEEWKL